MIRCGMRSLAQPQAEPTLLDLYKEEDHDSRGAYACRTDNLRPRHVAPDTKWESIFVRCWAQVRIEVYGSIFCNLLHIYIYVCVCMYRCLVV